MRKRIINIDNSCWGIPAGKSESGETEKQTAVREVNEETGIPIVDEEIEHLGKLNIEYDDWIVNFSIFYVHFETPPKVVLNSHEHQDYQWAPPCEILKRSDLMKDVDVIMKEYCLGKLDMRKI
jgi:8-oxo-dGTP pyrophosphatase MutT (NUDIX family)